MLRSKMIFDLSGFLFLWLLLLFQAVSMQRMICSPKTSCRKSSPSLKMSEPFAQGSRIGFLALENIFIFDMFK